MSNKGKPHRRRKSGGDTPAKPYDLDAYWQDTTPNVFDSPAYIATRDTVRAIVERLRVKRDRRKRKGDADLFVTLGAVSKQIPRECVWLLEFILPDLADAGVLAYDNSGLRTLIRAA